MVEVTALCKIQTAGGNENICEFFDFKKESNAIILELLEGPSLFAAVKQRREPVSERLAACWTRQLLSGISFSHSCGVSHRDVKPDNVVFSNGCLKLIDFGQAAMGSADSRGVRSGSLAYRPPEELLDDAPYSALPSALAQGVASDLWAAGLVVLFLLAGSLPFKATGLDELIKSISAFERSLLAACGRRGPRRAHRRWVPVSRARALFARLVGRAQISKQLARVLLALLNPDPSERVPAAAVLRFAWFTQATGYDALAAPRPIPDTIAA